METRQYAVGDVITMHLMRREKGSLVALPSSQWVKVEETVYFGGERRRSRRRSDSLVVSMGIGAKLNMRVS